jgi:hypothetical protein
MTAEQKKKKLSREYTTKEAAEEMKGVDKSLPVEATIHRRPLVSDRAIGGAEHRAGVEEEVEELRPEERPTQKLPPRGKPSKEGA